MKPDVRTAARTVDYLKRIIPRGHDEADELHQLIKFYEQMTAQKAMSR